MMASFSSWVFVVLALVGIGYALELDGVPQCATSCLLDNLKHTSCAQEDTQCLCRDQVYNDISTKCVSLNCTVQEALTTKNLTSLACGDPIRSKDSVFDVSRPILIAFKTIFLAVRLSVKVMGHGGGWGWDDYTIIIAFGTSIGMTAMTFLMQQNGIGRDIWTLMLDQVSHFLKFFFVFELLYIISLGFIKTSLMSFYARHFPSPNVRLTLQLTQLVNIFLIIAFAAATMLQCQPLSYFWTGWDDSTIADLKRGQCFNINAFGYAQAGFDIGLNVWLLALPLVQLVWKRKLDDGKKLGVAAMFVMGIGVTAIGIVRLRYLWYVKNTANVTHDYFGVASFSGLEVDTGIILACLPAMRLFCTKIILSIPTVLARPCSTTSPTTPEDSKKLISKPINKQPLPENHDWGFAKKHGYYDEHYDDWDCRISWAGGPRDTEATNRQKQAQIRVRELPPTPSETVTSPTAQAEAIGNSNLDLQPPSPPFYASHHRRESCSQRQPQSNNPSSSSFLIPCNWCETLTSWRDRRETKFSARRSTWRSTSRRDTTTSRIGEIKIMIDRAILRSESPVPPPPPPPPPPKAPRRSSNRPIYPASSPRRELDPEMGMGSPAGGMPGEDKRNATASEANHGGWI